MDHLKKTKPKNPWKLQADWFVAYCNHCQTEWAEHKKLPETCNYCGKEINAPNDPPAPR
jgi:hypothetical protein